MKVFQRGKRRDKLSAAAMTQMSRSGALGAKIGIVGGAGRCIGGAYSFPIEARPKPS